MREVLLGPRGDNLLGFLSAVGTLNTLDRAWPKRAVRLGWELEGGSWLPVIVAEGEGAQQAIIDAVAGELNGTATSTELTALGDDLPVSAADFRRVATSARSEWNGSRRTLDFLAAFGHDAVPDGEDVQDTAFRTMSGAGHQHFLLFMRTIAAETTPENLRTALFEAWRYQDPRPSMRWDANDDRRYALRSFDPGDTNRSPILTVRGANRLAIEALTMFPVIPTAGRDRTRGFSRLDRETVFTWPIWKAPLRRAVVQTLAGHPDLPLADPERGTLRPLGVVEVYRCRRINVDRFRNFTPAVACWGTGPVRSEDDLGTRNSPLV